MPIQAGFEQGGTSRIKGTKEYQRLLDSYRRKADWKHWGPYVSERAWGTVREDYSGDGAAWDFFPHDQARSRAYRWNEDGLGGVCNRHQNICLGVALWNTKDPILKERLFGLTGSEGNHGEDVKEQYFYVDSTPTHTYMCMLYKYPQAPYPYADLVNTNRSRSRHEMEYELLDALSEDFKANRYFDVYIEYAKADDNDILCKITAHNRNEHDAAPLHILPHVWYRNYWSWGYSDRSRPNLTKVDGPEGTHTVLTDHRHVGGYHWYTDLKDSKDVDLLFTENETNNQRLYGTPNAGAFVKDGINDCVVNGRTDAVNPNMEGTKVAAHYHTVVPPGGSFVVRTRFSSSPNQAPFGDFDEVFAARKSDADEFYNAVAHPKANPEEKLVQRQAFAGMLWSKMFYHYGVQLWLDGDPIGLPPPDSRKSRSGRNVTWRHLYCNDVISMPDKWEYPWFAAWDLAFHTVPLAMVDPEWAKRQLMLVLREWYMHPNGQIPAYEWNFSDVNPPVHAWATIRVYQTIRDVTGHSDIDFLEKVFHKLLLNFTWWVNRKDATGNNVFEGGFLGLDNIGVFDRSNDLPQGGHLEQADGTAWMGMYCLNMLTMALELAVHRPAYEDVATKFFEHFLYIANAINGHYSDTQCSDRDASGLWNNTDGFYYDRLHLPSGSTTHLKLRSFVGLIPIFAVEVLEPSILEKLPAFKARMEWFIRYRPQMVSYVADLTEYGYNGRLLLSLVGRKSLTRVLTRMADSKQFLSDYGLRSMSKEHEEAPYRLQLGGQEFSVAYEPAESSSAMFGGNSNWRGPIWFPVNYLMIEALHKYHSFYGPSLQIPVTVGGSPANLDLDQLADEISQRLIRVFVKDKGQRAFWGGARWLNDDPHWKDLVLFYEFFHGDNGAGIGASHQTGWTGLVANLIGQVASRRSVPAPTPSKRLRQIVTSDKFRALRDAAATAQRCSAAS